MATGFVSLFLKSTEVEQLLNLIGHDEHAFDNSVVKIVRSLYLMKTAFSSDTEEMPIEMEEEGLVTIHKYVTAQAFGQGGREFLVKVARAFVELERLELMPEIALVEEDGTAWDEKAKLGVARWKDLEGKE